MPKCRQDRRKIDASVCEAQARASSPRKRTFSYVRRQRSEATPGSRAIASRLRRSCVILVVLNSTFAFVARMITQVTFTRITWLILLLAICACGKGSGQSDEKAPAGKVLELVGTATATREGKVRDLRVGSSVFRDDVVKTGKGAEIEIALTHNSATWRLGGEAQVRVGSSAAWKLAEGSAGVLDSPEKDQTTGAGVHTEKEATDPVTPPAPVAKEAPKPEKRKRSASKRLEPPPQDSGGASRGSKHELDLPVSKAVPTKDKKTRSRTVSAAVIEMRKCLKPSSSRGTLVVTVTIGANGRVKSATADNKKLNWSECAVDAVKKLRFPEAPEGETLTFTLESV